MDDHRPRLRPGLAQLILRLSDIALLAVVWLVAQLVFFPPTFFGSGRGQSVNLWGIPLGAITVALGVAGVVIGWLWIRRIARGEPEPEAHDEFWWSRTEAPARVRLPTRGWILTRAMLWSADFAIVLIVIVGLPAAAFPEPVWSSPASTVPGVPSALALVLAGLGLAIVGRLWMERILNVGSEPETNDRFWWSRA